MKMSARGLAMLARFEGLVPGPYRDGAGVWTFGIGHTAAAGAPDPQAMPRGMPGDLDRAINDAVALFRRDIAKYEAEVLRAVRVPLAQHEFDALVSFHYNTGGIARAVLTARLNAGDRAGAKAGFMGWLKPASIRTRREAEMRVFGGGAYPEGTIPVWPVDAAGNVSFARTAATLPASTFEPDAIAPPRTGLAGLWAWIVALFQGGKT